MDLNDTFPNAVTAMLNISEIDFSKYAYIGDLSTPPALEVVLKTTFFVLIIVVALLGNIVVVSVIFRDATLHNGTFFFICNLAVSDILVTVCCTWVFLVKDLTKAWVLGPFFCRFNSFCQGKFSLVNSIHM